MLVLAAASYLASANKSRLTPPPASRRLRNCRGCGESRLRPASHFPPRPWFEPGRPRKEFSIMANHVSSLKRARQTVTKTAVNRANKSKLRGTLRTLREAIVAGDKKTL